MIPPYSPMQTLYTAAQLWLKQEGFYAGKIDGDWGKLSQAAAEAWQASARFPLRVEEDDGSTPYEVARNYLGTREIPGVAHNPRILRWLRAIGSLVGNDETAWCSTFVNYCALVTGRERTGSLAARSWLSVGEEIPLSQVKQGDVIILWRVSKTSWKGHVAFLDRYTPRSGMLYLLGGNQNDEVNILPYPVSQFLGARRLRTLDLLENRTA